MAKLLSSFITRTFLCITPLLVTVSACFSGGQCACVRQRTDEFQRRITERHHLPTTVEVLLVGQRCLYRRLVSVCTSDSPLSGEHYRLVR
ncbi:MAG: hypothetical protein RSG77_20005 [Hafnia sp.]